MLVLILLLICANLFATTYSSNAIGQLIEQTEQLSQLGYEVEVEGNTTSLYLDGALIETTTIEENLKTITKGERVETVKTEDGLCVYRALKDSNSFEETYYEWDENTLKRKRIVQDRELKSVITYFMDGENLIGYQEALSEDKSVVLINNGKLGYTLGNDSGEVINHYDNLIFKTEYSTASTFTPPIVEEKDELLIIIDENEKTSYDKGGLIVQKEYTEDDNIIKTLNYTYDEQKQVQEEVVIEGDKKIISSYKEGRVEKITTYVNEELFSIRYYESDIYEIRYKNGKPYARLSYDEDGKSLMELKML